MDHHRRNRGSRGWQVAPVRSVRAGGVGIGVSTRWRRDNRPDFPGFAVWVDAVAEIEIDAEAFGLDERDQNCQSSRAGRRRRSSQSGEDLGFGAVGDGERRGGGEAWAGAGSQDPDDGATVPRTVDAWSPEFGEVWRPLLGSGREPRPGLLLSVVRAGTVVAYPTPLPDPATGALARALARLERPDRSGQAERSGRSDRSSQPAQSGRPGQSGRPDRPSRSILKVLPIESAAPQSPRPAPPKAYGDVRALVGVLVEILVGRRAAAHAAPFTDPEVRGRLRKPHYPRTAALTSVRLVESGAGVEATALLQDRGRTRVVALRFDRAEDSRWRCTALQAG